MKTTEEIRALKPEREEAQAQPAKVLKEELARVSGGSSFVPHPEEPEEYLFRCFCCTECGNAVIILPYTERPTRGDGYEFCKKCQKRTLHRWKAG